MMQMKKYIPVFVAVVLILGVGNAWADSCTSEQVELFSCPLKSKTIVALCLNKEKLNTELARIDPQGAKTVTPISDLKQFFDIGNGHGYTTILQGKTSKGKISLFIATYYYDQVNPALSIDNRNESHAEFCFGSKYSKIGDGKYSLPRYELKIKSETKWVELSNLLSLGISAPLAEDDVPNWPDEEGYPTKYHHHNAERKSSPEPNKGEAN